MKIVKAETILLAIPFESGGPAPWGWGGSPANTFDVLLVRLGCAALTRAGQRGAPADHVVAISAVGSRQKGSQLSSPTSAGSALA